MYDRQTETWWQQFMGEAVVGDLTGAVLDVLPGMRPYGSNPYDGYDGSAFPFLYDGEVPDGIKPLERVVALAGKTEAWALDLLRREGEVTASDGTVLRWTPGQNSALDTRRIKNGKDVGNVTAIKDGEDVPYFVDFAFAFHAFRPDAPIHLAVP